MKHYSFTKKSAQIKLLQGTLAIDLEDLTAQKSHKKIGDTPITIILGEYCQIQSFSINFGRHEIYKLQNLMKHNTLIFKDVYANTSFTTEPVISSDKEEFMYNVGDYLHRPHTVTRGTYYYLLPNLRKFFGTEPKSQTTDFGKKLRQHTAQQPANLSACYDVYDKVNSDQQSQYYAMLEHLNQSRELFKMMRMDQDNYTVLAGYISKFNVAEALKDYTPSGLYSSVLTPVPNYGRVYHSTGQGAYRVVQSSYTSLYAPIQGGKMSSNLVAGQYTVLGSHQLESDMVDYLVNEFYQLGEPSYKDLRTEQEALTLEFNQLKASPDMSAIKAFTPKYDRLMELDFQLGQVTIGDTSKLDAVITSNQLPDHYQAVEKASSITPTLAGAKMFDIITKRVREDRSQK